MQEGLSSPIIIIIIIPGTVNMSLWFGTKLGKGLLSPTLTRRQAQRGSVICKGHAAQACGFKSSLSDSRLSLLTTQFPCPAPQTIKDLASSGHLRAMQPKSEPSLGKPPDWPNPR